MAKPSIYTPREQEVLDSPDFYLIRLFQQARGWHDSRPLTAREALHGYEAIKKDNQNHRMSLYAARKINDEVRLACVTPAYLSALVQVNAAQ